MTQKTTPKSVRLEKSKEIFLAALEEGGGNVSRALRESGLGRVTAYTHYTRDAEFKEKWDEAIERGIDEIHAEIRYRAGMPTYDDNGRLRPIKRRSDRLLIHLHKHSEYKIRWRRRLIEIGEVSLETVTRVGEEIGLTQVQITALQDGLLEKYRGISTL